MKYNWGHKSLEDLEKNQWMDFGRDSQLLKKTKELRRIPVNTFTTEDLRIMIGQQLGLDYLIPLAIETLTVDLFAEGDLFEGDLLKNVLAINTVFWDNNKNYWCILNDLIKNRRYEIQKNKFDTSNFDSCKHRC